MNVDDAVKITDKAIDTVKKTPLSIVFIMLSICLLMVYWFVAIFLFHKEFYDRNTVYIVLLFSFAFSLTWLILSVGLSILVDEYRSKTKKKGTNLEGILFAGGFASVIYLCFSFLITYILRKYCTITFDCFLLISYLYMALQLVRVGFVYFLKREEKNSQVSK